MFVRKCLVQINVFVKQHPQNTISHSGSPNRRTFLDKYIGGHSFEKGGGRVCM